MKSRLKAFFSRLFSTKRPFKLTRAGWVFILYSIGVGAGAINTGNNLLYIVFGIFLGLLLASGVLSDLSLWGLEISWIFPSSLRAGERADVWLTVTNTKRWWSSLGVSVILEGTLAGQSVQFSAYAPCVRKGEASRLPASWTPARRGEFVLERIRVSTRYPFGLLEKWWRLYRGTPVVTALVQPQRVAVAEQAMWEALSGDERSSSRRALQQGSSSSTVRDFHAGDNPRRIHWRASAKRSDLGSTQLQPAWLVRQMEPEEQHRVVLDWPTGLDLKDWDAGSIERLTSFAASLHERLIERGWSVDVVLDDRLILDPLALFALWNPSQPWRRGKMINFEKRNLRGRMELALLFEKLHRHPVP